MNPAFLLVFAVLVPSVLSSCGGKYLPAAQRIDCHPEPGANGGKCSARNCIWCPPADGERGPWCYYRNSNRYGCDDGFLKSSQRVDCHPEPNANEATCRRRNCAWCPIPGGGKNIPWCYFNGK